MTYKKDFTLPTEILEQITAEAMDELWRIHDNILETRYYHNVNIQIVNKIYSGYNL